MSDRPITINLNILRLSMLATDTVTRLWSEASEERRLRAERLARQEDALRCLASEALLRYALRKCGLDDTLTPRIADKGKPYVEAEHFHYNISHSGDWVVIAYGERQVGVDVEKIDRGAHRDAIAQKHFTPAEQSILFDDTASEEERTSRFTLLWTRKESYVKYTGQGLSCALSTFSVDASLPRGRVLDAADKPLDIATESFFLDEAHILSVCGKFDALRVDNVTGKKLFG